MQQPQIAELSSPPPFQPGQSANSIIQRPQEPQSILSSQPPSFEQQESDDSELTSWLKENDLQQYYQPLVAKEIESLDDLTLFSRSELAEMAAEFSMSLKTRKKFIMAVEFLTQLPPSYVSPQIPVSSILCPEHETPVGVVCETDNTLVCYLCLATTHNGHRVKTLSKAAGEEKIKIQNALENLKHKVHNLETGISKVKNTRMDLSKRGLTVEKQIQTCFERCRHICNERELKLVAEVKKIVNSKLDTLSQQQKSIECILSGSTRLVAETETILKAKEDAVLLQLWKNIAERFDVGPVIVPQPNISGDIFFYEPADLFPTLKRSGKVQESLTSPEHTIATGSGLIGFIRGKVSSFIVIAKDKQGRKRTSGGDMFRIELKACNAEVGFTDKQNGTYIVSYKIDSSQDENKIHLAVLFGLRHIVGSPFSIRAAKVDIMDMSRVKAITASEESVDHKKENTLSVNYGCWASNNNQSQYIVYSLGGRRQINGIILSWTRMISKQSSPKEIHIMIADDRNGPWVVEHKFSRPKEEQKTSCDLSCIASFLKICFLSNHGGARFYLSNIKIR